MPRKRVSPRRKEFLLSFAQFYEKFFENSAEAVEMLAEIQTDYPNEYNVIREFSSDPTAIKDLINKLDPEKRGILLNILLQAGNFGIRMANLFESGAKEKIKLAAELRGFARELSKHIKEK